MGRNSNRFNTVIIQQKKTNTTKKTIQNINQQKQKISLQTHKTFMHDAEASRKADRCMRVIQNMQANSTQKSGL